MADKEEILQAIYEIKEEIEKLSLRMVELQVMVEE